MADEREPGMVVRELPGEDEAEPQLQSINFAEMEVEDLFHLLEKDVAGYDDYVNSTEAHFARTIEGLHELVTKIQKQSLFSANESLDEIQTNHLKMLMVPYLEAEVLFRTMTDRASCVKKAHTYYLEFLKLMNHYRLLETLQVKVWKALSKENRERNNQSAVDSDGDEEEKKNVEHPIVQLARQMEDRDTKIANYRAKKALEANLDRLRNYENEEMKREFYLQQLKLAIMNSFEQMRLTELELDI